MKHIWGLLLLVISLISSPAIAQGLEEAPKDGEVNAQFASMTKELGFLCGELLPNQVPTITEIMALCGGRAGFKIGPKTTLEPMLVSGAGNGQSYILGSTSLRGDLQIDDIVSSFYIGADIHYVTGPVFDVNGNATSNQTNLFFGGHLGGAFWFELSDSIFFRTDLQFNLNPGTSLFLGFGLVLRFDRSSGEGPVALQ